MRKFVIALCLIGAHAIAQTEKDSTANVLDEVIIQSDKKTFSYKNGDIKVDVANSIYQSVSNTVELLAKLPKIQVAPDRESVTVIGKGNPLIYIDSQKSTMNDLDALAVTDIKSIEIISNPSSKYEADGRVVILITRKFSKKEGFQFGANTTSAVKKGFNQFLGANASLKQGKTTMKANINYNLLEPWERNSNDYQIPNSGIASDYLVGGFTDRRQILFGASGIRQINSDDYLTLSISGKRQDGDFRLATITNYTSANGFTHINTVGNNRGNRNFTNSVANYNNKLTQFGGNFFAGLQYSRFSQHTDSRAFNSYNGSAFAPFRKGMQEFVVDAVSAKTDLEKTFKRDLKVEFGLAYTFSDAATELNLSDLESQTDTSSKYRLTEQNGAMYAQASGGVGKWAWNAGARLELTEVLGQLQSDATPVIDKHYLILFPKAGMTLTVDSSKTISINYSRGISRPDYSSMSNGVTYINPYFLFSGNTNLRPSTADQVEAVFQYREWTLKASSYWEKGTENYSFLYDASAEVLTFRPENFDRSKGYSVEVTAPFKYGKWSSSTILSVNGSMLEDDTAQTGISKPFVYFFSDHTLKLKNELTISATAWGFSDRADGIFDNKGVVVFNAAASKNFGKHFMCTISANDIFGKANYTQKFGVSGVRTTARYYTDSREFSISLNYTFGKSSGTYEEKAVNESMGRIK